MDDVKSKILIKTFDGLLMKLAVKPKCMNSTVEFNVNYYDYDGDQSLVKAKVTFRNVISLDFEINLFDNYIGAELFGFYEVFSADKKKEMIEKIFLERRSGFLYHGDYDYDASEEHDMLNFREPVENIFAELEQYHLYQQQTQGGIYWIMAKGYELTNKGK